MNDQEMREAKLEAACVKYAKSRGWLHAKLDPKGNVGVPDHVFFGPALLRPKFVVVEFKVGRNTQTAKQLAWAEKFARLTGVVWLDPTAYPDTKVHVIRTLKEFKELLG